MTNISLLRRGSAELVGTALLLVAVVGSGIAAARMSQGDDGLQLLENAIATAAALAAIILAVGAVSGAHLNPVVTLADRVFGGVGTLETVVYVAAQFLGATLGVVVANLMFDLPAIDVSGRVRDGSGTALGEAVATFGLLLVVFGVARAGRRNMAPFAVAAYIGGAYFFTSSTSFANPAVTTARMLTDTFTGIAPRSVPAFLGAELVGGLVALGVIILLYPRVRASASDVIVPHPEERAA